MKTLTTLLISAGLTGLPAVAQDEVFDLDAITVFANRTATELGRVGSSVSVVTDDDLEVSGETTVAGYLATLPGLNLTTQGPVGNSATLRIRGADGRYIAVFVDGIRVSDPSGVTTSFDFGSMLTADVGRIEVLRGSQSALYGGSAVGGVINIMTRRPTEDGVKQSLATETGSYGTAQLSYGFTQKDGDLETSLSVTALTTDGFSAASSGTEADGSTALRLGFGARYQMSDRLAVGANVFRQRTELDFDGFDPLTFLPADEANALTRTETGVRAFAELATGSTDHVFDLTSYAIDRDFDLIGTPSSFDGNRTTLSWQATTTVSDSLSLIYGADTMREEAQYSNLPGSTADTTISGAFLQSIWAPMGNFDLSSTLRYDDHSAFGGFNTGRIAAAFRPSDNVTLRAAVATGFRAPSIDELYGDYPIFFFTGNPNLEPEESRSYEIGAERTFGDAGRIAATVFHLEVESLITTDPTFSTLINVPGASVRKGAELAAEVQMGERAALTAAYTYTDATRPDGTRLGLIPRHELSLRLGAEVSSRVTAGVTLRHAADRLDDFAAGPMPDYTVVGASVTYDLGNDAEVYLRAENILDETYELSNGYATPGRSVYVGLRRTF